jgi:hypothetical protein
MLIPAEDKSFFKKIYVIYYIRIIDSNNTLKKPNCL